MTTAKIKEPGFHLHQIQHVHVVLAVKFQIYEAVNPRRWSRTEKTTKPFHPFRTECRTNTEMYNVNELAIVQGISEKQRLEFAVPSVENVEFL